MAEWVISPEDGAAYLDLRGLKLGFAEAERMLEMLEPYLGSPHLSRVVIEVRGLDPLPAAVEMLITSVEARRQAHGEKLHVLHPGGVGDQPIS
jgi:hypothetical protein